MKKGCHITILSAYLFVAVAQTSLRYAMGIKMNSLIYSVGLFLSSFVSVRILMDFLNNLFERKSYNKSINFLVETLFTLILAGVNALKNEWMNLITVIILSGIIAVKMYYGNYIKKFLHIIILVISMSACESIGVLLLHYIYNISDIVINSEMMRLLFDITITQVFVVFISHIIIIQIMKKKNINNLTNQQYFFTFVYAVFSILNIYILSVLMKDMTSEGEIIFVLITIVGVVVINTYFLTILEFASENKRLQYENQLFMQQSKMQYQYYDYLEIQYRESLSIIHDVKRHIRTIEELYYHRENETAKEYTEKINSSLEAFQLNEYTDNRVLNIILHDKSRMAEQNNIMFTCKIEDLDLSFIDTVDLVTIFANLLDNAIEACIELKKERIILVQVGAFNNLVVIEIKNTMEDPLPGKGKSDIALHRQFMYMPQKSYKKNHSGIGIPNVMKVVGKYNGDFNIQREGDMFVCSIVLSKQGRQDK